MLNHAAIVALIALTSSQTAIADGIRLSVPYVKQRPALCGGAAAAMVLKYWGSDSADAGEFSTLVDRRASGIASDTLATAISDRGWRTVQFTGSIDTIKDRLRAGQPIVILMHERGERFHYVVVIGYTSNTIVVHDPARGPLRAVRNDRFIRGWRDAGFWALLVLPNAIAR